MEIHASVLSAGLYFGASHQRVGRFGSRLYFFFCGLSADNSPLPSCESLAMTPGGLHYPGSKSF